MTLEVSRVGWYMGAYYASSLKRQFAYANSPAIRRLDRGQLQVTRARLQRSNRTIKTRRSYTNKAGRLCYQGTKELKSTETLDYNTYIYIYMCLYYCFVNIYIHIILCR